LTLFTNELIINTYTNSTRSETMHKPSNIIITVVGFFLVYGAVGTLDADPSASVVQMFGIACAGLALMFAGTNALTNA
jgi:Co/Zn/Cd efflux system component